MKGLVMNTKVSFDIYTIHTDWYPSVLDIQANYQDAILLLEKYNTLCVSIKTWVTESTVLVTKTQTQIELQKTGDCPDIKVITKFLYLENLFPSSRKIVKKLHYCWAWFDCCIDLFWCLASRI